MGENAALIRLLLVTPDGKRTETECDEVRLSAPDGVQGRGGGSFGVRRGHIAALAALEKGEVCALTGGKPVLRAEIPGGFARIDGESVTVMTGSFDILA